MKVRLPFVALHALSRETTVAAGASRSALSAKPQPRSAWAVRPSAASARSCVLERKDRRASALASLVSMSASKAEHLLAALVLTQSASRVQASALQLGPAFVSFVIKMQGKVGPRGAWPCIFQEKDHEFSKQGSLRVLQGGFLERRGGRLWSSGQRPARWATRSVVHGQRAASSASSNCPLVHSLAPRSFSRSVRQTR